MPPRKFLHELADFSSLIRVVSDELEILPILVEKDYWLMHCLWALQQNKLTFQLKGGTSLSKGFNLISRFSEDVDIHIEPPEYFAIMTGKNHNRPAHIESRRIFYDWLVKTLTLPSIVAIERDSEFDDINLRSAGIRLIYRSDFEMNKVIKPFVLLEVGFDVVTPNEPVTISSWAYDHAVAVDAKIFDNRAHAVPCYLPEYTLVEKLSAILNKYRQQQREGRFPKNFMRHYYDIYALLGRSEVVKFIGSPEYLAHKKARFSSKENFDLSQSEAFLLSDPSVRKLYSNQYNQIRDFFFKVPPSFEEILSGIQVFLPRL